jgi:transcriptional regulator with XRE-family HTH domain
MSSASQPELRHFLIAARARLRPRDVGLPTVGRRQVPGLRREEVAELAGVSVRWYELFETGTSGRRFSPEFVESIANALRLDQRERARLIRLALPEIGAARELFERSIRDGVLDSFNALRAFARSVSNASSFHEAAYGAVETVQGFVSPDSMTVASLENDGVPPALFAAGPGALYADEALARFFLDSRDPVRIGATRMCEDVPDPREITDDASHPVRIKTRDGRELMGVHSPDVCAYREANGRTGQKSGLAVGLFDRGVFRGMIGSFWKSSRQHREDEVAGIETAAAILDLVASVQT